MGRLFRKFFFAIWIAQILGTMSAMLAVQATHRIEPRHRTEAVPDRSVNSLIDYAVATLHHEGLDELRKMKAELVRKNVLAIDENGRDLFGRAVDQAALNWAKDHADQEGAADNIRRIHLADGRSYLFYSPPTAGAAGSGNGGALPPHEGTLLPIEPLIAHLVASLIVAGLLAHYLSKPIDSLHSALRAIAAGNLHVGIADSVKNRNDELADLLREFDRMAGQVRFLVEGQRRLFHDISHEVRSPLARMQVAVGLSHQQPRKSVELLNRIDCEINRVDQLIGELLALARLTNADAGIAHESVYIDEILKDIVESARFEAAPKRQAIRYAGKTGAVLQGSPELLYRAIENVVRNAIKHTQDESTIQVSAKIDSSGSWALICVNDDGPGVAHEELELIFESFVRSGKQDRDTDGQGLGLAIAKRIVEAHDGTIKARNLARGGLSIEMLLPLSPHVSR